MMYIIMRIHIPLPNHWAHYRYSPHKGFDSMTDRAVSHCSTDTFPKDGGERIIEHQHMLPHNPFKHESAIESMGPPLIPSQFFLHVVLAVEATCDMNLRPAALLLEMLHVLLELFLRARQSKATTLVMGTHCTLKS